MIDTREVGGEPLPLHVIDELHDGVLQFLTAAGLQIEVILRLGEDDPTAALRRLHQEASVNVVRHGHARERRLGPQTLKRRVRSLGGRLHIVSGRGGSVLRVDLSLGQTP